MVSQYLKAQQQQHWSKNEKHDLRKSAGERDAWECAESLNTSSEQMFLTFSLILKGLS